MDGGLELRAAGRDKGMALRELIEQADKDALPVFLGDDIADEDAFREVVTRGFGIRVGPSVRPSLARGRIETCEAMVDFLRCWRSARRDSAPKGAPTSPEVSP
jgi:trehalose-phosphatase